MLTYTFNFSKNKRFSEHHCNRKLKVVLWIWCMASATCTCGWSVYDDDVTIIPRLSTKIPQMHILIPSSHYDIHIEIREREIMLFIGKPIGRSWMISLWYTHRDHSECIHYDMHIARRYAPHPRRRSDFKYLDLRIQISTLTLFCFCFVWVTGTPIYSRENLFGILGTPVKPCFKFMGTSVKIC